MKNKKTEKPKTQVPAVLSLVFILDLPFPHQYFFTLFILTQLPNPSILASIWSWTRPQPEKRKNILQQLLLYAMFYSHFILAKKGPLIIVWIAAYPERKLCRNQVAETNRYAYSCTFYLNHFGHLGSCMLIGV